MTNDTNEIEFMTGETDFDKAAAILRERWPNIRLLNVTAGADGSRAYYGPLRVVEPGCSRGGVIETTGAGDTFCACVTAAYLVTTKRGAIRSMPERAAVEALLPA